MIELNFDNENAMATSRHYQRFEKALRPYVKGHVSWEHNEKLDIDFIFMIRYLVSFGVLEMME